MSKNNKELKFEIMDKILELKTLKLKAEMEKDWASLQLLMQELTQLRKEIDNLG